MTQANPIEIAKTAHLVFKLRDDIASILTENMTVNEQGEIAGHDAAAEEIIVRVAGEFQP